MKLSKYILLLLFTNISFLAFSQETDSTFFKIDDYLEQQIENISEQAESEYDFDDIIKDIEYLKYNPININSDNEEELFRLPLLNEQQIKNIQQYKQQFGALSSLYELIVIEGFNEEFITLIEPYIIFSEQPLEKFNIKRAFKYGRTNVTTKYQRVLQEQQGFAKVSDSIKQLSPNKYFIGSPDALMIKAQFKYKHFLRFGFVTEKDPGEALFPKQDTLPKGFDFYSFHFMLNDIGIVKQLAIGDYRVQFGQGLTIWNGFTMGKSANYLLSRKRGDAIRPHSSANEYAFMRGAATTISLKKFDLTAFFSKTKRDANTNIIKDTISGDEEMIVSIQQTGYHRTPNEIAAKNAVDEIAFGGRLAYNLPRLRVATSVVHLGYNHDFADQNALYKMFYPSLKSNTFASIDYSANYKTLTLYGEAAKQFDAGFAVLQGVNFVPDPRLSFSAIFRNFEKNFYNPLSNAFGQNTNNTNERGMYIGVQTTPFQKIILTAYADFYKYTWLKYRVDAPSHGKELATQLTYNISRRGDLFFSYRNIENPINFNPENLKLNKVISTTREYFRVQLNYKPLSWLKIQNRVELVKRTAENNQKEYGYLIFQGLQISPVNKNWSIYMRYVLFDTDSYDTRLYTFENDVPGTFSVPALSGNGNRFYVMFRSKINSSTTIYLRYSNSFYNDRDVISSGLTEIDGKNKSEVKAVLNFRF